MSGIRRLRRNIALSEGYTHHLTRLRSVVGGESNRIFSFSPGAFARFLQNRYGRHEASDLLADWFRLSPSKALVFLDHLTKDVNVKRKTSVWNVFLDMAFPNDLRDFMRELRETDDYMDYLIGKDQHGRTMGHTKRAFASPVDDAREFYLPPDTWLVHFTNDAEEILKRGFRGTVSPHKLGLTRSRPKNRQGYNFAYLADSDSAEDHASGRDGSYGSVESPFLLFKSAGIQTYHVGDRDHQVIFWGKSVPRGQIILVERPKQGIVAIRGKNGRILKQGRYREVIDWVKTNERQYRKLLYGRDG